MRYWRYIGYTLLDGLLYLLGIFIVPFLWFKKEAINSTGKGFWWWFLNDTTKQNDSDIDWGLYGRFSHNFFGYYKQCAFRNSHWNFRVHVNVPNQGDKDNLTPIGADTTFYRMPFVGEKPVLGEQSIKYEIGGVSYFRYSTLYISKSPWLVRTKYFYTIKSLPTLKNIQLGAGDYRYICKFKRRKYIKN